MTARRWVAAALAGVAATVVVATPARADTVRQGQWYLDALHVDAAHQISTGAGVTVAVIDQMGVDASHPDLAGQVLPGTAIGVDSPNGWSTSKDAFHATGVAGVIAAKGGGPMHALGIAPDAKILPVALVPKASDEQLAQGIRWAVDHGAKVINMSLGVDEEAPQVEIDAVRYALSKDVVLVAAAGNAADGDQRVLTPARIPGVIAVSATDRNADLWSGSVSGPEVAISAPGVDIVTTSTRSDASSGYISATGTSSAAPIVAGAAALVRSKYPNLNAANVINRLLVTAMDQGPSGRDPQYGYGTVKLLDALNKDVPPVSANPLGEPGAGAGPSAGPSGSQAGSYHLVSPPGHSHSGRRIVIIVAMAGGAVLAVVLAIVIVAVRRSRRSSPIPPRGPIYPAPPQAAAAPFPTMPPRPPGLPGGQNGPPGPPPLNPPVWPPGRQ